MAVFCRIAVLANHTLLVLLRESPRELREGHEPGEKVSERGGSAREETKEWGPWVATGRVGEWEGTVFRAGSGGVVLSIHVRQMAPSA